MTSTGQTSARLSPEPILRVSAGYMAAKFLFVASRIGMFEALAQGPRTAAQLGAELGRVRGARAPGGPSLTCPRHGRLSAGGAPGERVGRRRRRRLTVAGSVERQSRTL